MAGYTGQQFGDYRLTQHLGAGGFADVYLGEHIYLGTRAAIKVLKGPFSPAQIAEFRTEAQTIARLEHPHIVRIITFSVAKITTQEIPFLVIEFAPNGTLRQRHPKGSRLPLQTIIGYVEQIAEGLQYAHNQKVIHRDIKPENLLLGRNNEILLSDFGIALTTPQTGTLSTQAMAGTVAYMSPETIRGKPRPASDQYALGVVVYEWICGQRPFLGAQWELVNQQINATPPPLREKLPTLSPDVEQVVLKALAKEAQQRFASVQEFAATLKQACQTMAASASPNLFSAQPVSVPSTDQPFPATQPAIPPRQETPFSAPPVSVPSTDQAVPPTQPAMAFVPPQPAFQQQAPSPKEPAPIVSPASNVAISKPRQGFPRNRVLLIAGLVILVIIVIGASLFLSTLNKPAITTNPTSNPTSTVTSSGAMFGYDLQRTHFNPAEHTLTATNVSQLVQDWTASTGGQVDSSPTVANGMVYVGSDDGKLYAFKASGCANPCLPAWTASTGGMIRSSPAVANGVVYIGSFDHKLYAFNASTGKPLWTATTGNIIRSSPAVANGMVYVGSQDGKLYAFKASGCNSTSCSPLWTGTTGNIIYYSSPAIANGMVYIGSEDSKLYAFNASGCNSASCSPMWTGTTEGSIESSPAVANGMIYIGSDDGKLYAFKADGCGSTSCGPVWAMPTGASVRSAPAVANGVVYVGSDDHKIYAFNASNGQIRWTGSAGNFIRSSPTVANGVVYVGSDDAKLYIFNASGCGSNVCQPLRTFATGNLIFSSPSVADGVVYFGSDDHMLYAFHLPGTNP